MSPYSVRATYSDVTWLDDEDGDPDGYEEESGWTDPSNPWGGFTSEDEPNVLVLDTLSEAVHFIVDFPGGVWDFREGERETVDYKTGRSREVTLHINDNDQERLFKWAGIIQGIEDRRRRIRPSTIRFSTTNKPRKGERGQRLTNAAHVYGSLDLYVGDDGALYLS